MKQKQSSIAGSNIPVHNHSTTIQLRTPSKESNTPENLYPIDITGKSNTSQNIFTEEFHVLKILKKEHYSRFTTFC